MRQIIRTRQVHIEREILLSPMKKHYEHQIRDQYVNDNAHMCCHKIKYRTNLDFEPHKVEWEGKLNFLPVRLLSHQFFLSLNSDCHQQNSGLLIWDLKELVQNFLSIEKCQSRKDNHPCHLHKHQMWLIHLGGVVSLKSWI